jgi:hypothetical protein
MKKIGNGTKKKIAQLAGAISLFLLYKLWNVLFSGDGFWENVVPLVLGTVCAYLLIKVIVVQEQPEEEEDERED